LNSSAYSVPINKLIGYFHAIPFGIILLLFFLSNQNIASKAKIRIFDNNCMIKNLHPAGYALILCMGQKMQGAGHADIIPVFQVTGKKTGDVP